MNNQKDYKETEEELIKKLERWYKEAELLLGKEWVCKQISRLSRYTKSNLNIGLPITKGNSEFETEGKKSMDSREGKEKMVDAIKASGLLGELIK